MLTNNENILPQQSQLPLNEEQNVQIQAILSDENNIVSHQFETNNAEPLNLSIHNSVASHVNENEVLNVILNNTNGGNESLRVNVSNENGVVGLNGVNGIELSELRTNSLGFASSTQTNRLSSDLLNLVNQLLRFNSNVVQSTPTQPQTVVQNDRIPQPYSQTYVHSSAQPQTVVQNDRISQTYVHTSQPSTQGRWAQPITQREPQTFPITTLNEFPQQSLNQPYRSDTYVINRARSVPNLYVPSLSRNENRFSAPAVESSQEKVQNREFQSMEQLDGDVHASNYSMGATPHRIGQTQQNSHYRSRTTFVPIYKWNIKFFGNPNDNVGKLTIFLREVELRQRMYNISDSELHANFIVLLDGPAKMWYLAHCNAFRSWPELRQAMQDKYIGKREHSFYMAIMNRKQGFKESIGEYFADMMLKMSAVPDLTSQRQIGILLNGLLPQYRQRVTGFQWQTANQLEDFLTNVEADLVAHTNDDSRRFHRFNQRENVAAISEESEVTSPVESMNEVCEMSRVKFSQGKRTKSLDKVSSIVGDNNSFPKAENMRGRCFKCGESGHLFRQCTKQRTRVFCFNCGEDNDDIVSDSSENSSSKNSLALACENNNQ